MQKFCTKCGVKLQLRKYKSVGFDGETGEESIGYQLICPNNKADSEGHSDDIVDLKKEEYEQIKMSREFVEVK